MNANETSLHRRWSADYNLTIGLSGNMASAHWLTKRGRMLQRWSETDEDAATRVWCKSAAEQLLAKANSIRASRRVPRSRGGRGSRSRRQPAGPGTRPHAAA